MEQPQLLITETLAFHDRRVKDTAAGSGGGMFQNHLRTHMTEPDETLDQFRVPQGSAFIELYCPRSTHWRNGVSPANQQPNQKQINETNVILGVNANNSPTWRLAFSKICRANATDPDYQQSPSYLVGDPTNTARVLESASLEPVRISLIPGGTNGPPPDRYAYFCPPNRIPEFADRSFCINNNTQPQIQPGQYAVVGPRTTTYLGSQDNNNGPVQPMGVPAQPPGSLWGGNSQQYIQVNPTTVAVYDTNNAVTTRTAGTDIRPPVGIVCDIQNDPTNPSNRIQPYTGLGGSLQWAAPCPWNIGLNVSEPLPFANHNYYPEPVPAVAVTEGPDFYDDPDAPTGTFPGQPVDSNHSSRVEAANNEGRPLSDLSADSGVDVTQSGTQLESTVYLQRLADPNAAWDPLLNPYMTVDWAAMDVTVFSGEEHTMGRTVASGAAMGQPFDEDDLPGGQIHFRTRQRGYHPANPAALYNPWSPITQNVGGQINLAPIPNRTYFSIDLSNNRDGNYLATNPGDDRHTLGYLNETISQLTTVNGYLGEPANPLPWLTWHNRPFSNPMELMYVPSSSPARAGFEVSAGNGYLTEFVGQSPYAIQASGPNVSSFRSPFANLLNFFHYENGNRRQEMELARLLDFVEVPSPYAGTERWYSPRSFGNLTGGQFTTDIRPPNFSASIFYRPPFNKLSRFRDPGRININTIFDEAIWDAAVGMFPNLRSTPPNQFVDATNVFQSRQGDIPANTSPLLQMSANSPTRFAQPFRTADSYDLMPNAGGMRKQFRG